MDTSHHPYGPSTRLRWMGAWDVSQRVSSTKFMFFLFFLNLYFTKDWLQLDYAPTFIITPKPPRRAQRPPTLNGGSSSRAWDVMRLKPSSFFFSVTFSYPLLSITYRYIKPNGRKGMTTRARDDASRALKWVSFSLSYFHSFQHWQTMMWVPKPTMAGTPSEGEGCFDLCCHWHQNVLILCSVYLGLLLYFLLFTVYTICWVCSIHAQLSRSV